MPLTDLFPQDVSVEEAGQVPADRLGVERLDFGEAERQPLALGRRQPLGKGLLKITHVALSQDLGDPTVEKSLHKYRGPYRSS